MASLYLAMCLILKAEKERIPGAQLGHVWHLWRRMHSGEGYLQADLWLPLFRFSVLISQLGRFQGDDDEGKNMPLSHSTKTLLSLHKDGSRIETEQKNRNKCVGGKL